MPVGAVPVVVGTTTAAVHLARVPAGAGGGDPGAQLGAVWVFDPQDVSGETANQWWDPPSHSTDEVAVPLDVGHRTRWPTRKVSPAEGGSEAAPRPRHPRSRHPPDTRRVGPDDSSSTWS